MGYTHRYRYAPSHATFRDAWPQMVADARRILERAEDAGIDLSDSDVSGKQIVVNGLAAAELDAEPLVILPTAGEPAPRHSEPRLVEIFCKTNRMPYDLTVCAILLRCHLIAPDVFLIMHSDGDWDREWLEDTPEGLSPRGLVAELFGDAATANPFFDQPEPKKPSSNPAHEEPMPGQLRIDLD